MNKKELTMINNYNNSNIYCLAGAYNRYSYNKEKAENKILEAMRKDKGWGYKICSYCVSTFTCGYLRETNAAGDIELVYHTPTNVYNIFYARGTK